MSEVKAEKVQRDVKVMASTPSDAAIVSDAEQARMDDKYLAIERAKFKAREQVADENQVSRKDDWARDLPPDSLLDKLPMQWIGAARACPSSITLLCTDEKKGIKGVVIFSSRWSKSADGRKLFDISQIPGIKNGTCPVDAKRLAYNFYKVALANDPPLLVPIDIALTQLSQEKEIDEIRREKEVEYKTLRGEISSKLGSIRDHILGKPE